MYRQVGFRDTLIGGWGYENSRPFNEIKMSEAHNDKSVPVCFDSTQSVIVVVEWRTDPANGEHVADWIVSGQAVVVERNG